MEDNKIIPKVSVIVPVYKVEKYLHRCIDSLLKQTLKEIEIILIDDGSPDKSGEMCDHFATLDERIKVIHKNNEGLGFARNDGLKAVTGEFVGFVDSDDFVDAMMFETLYMAATEKNLDAVFGGYYVHSSTGKPDVKKSEVENECIFSDKKERQTYLLGMIGSEPTYFRDAHFTMSVWRGIYRNQIISQYNCTFPSEREVISEDIIFHIQFISHANRIAVLPECFYYYCENDQSLTHTFRQDRFLKVIRLIECIKDLFYEYGFEDEKNQSCDRLLLARARGAIRSALRNEGTLGKAKVDQAIMEILNNDSLRECISRYDWRKLPISQRIFFLAMKLKCVYGVKWFIRTNDARKK